MCGGGGGEKRSCLHTSHFGISTSCDKQVESRTEFESEDAACMAEELLFGCRERL